MSDQAANLRRQINDPSNSKKAKTISIVSGKGGVGKSNFALNFSLELLNRGEKVLLFDLDLGMGNIDILLGLHAEKTMIDMLNHTISVHEIIEKGPSGLDYIAGGSGLTELFTMNQEKVDSFFRQYKELINTYDYILFDMGAGAAEDSILFILASDECIVITTPEPTSIMDAYGMIKHIINNKGDMPIYVVMNRCFTERIGKQALVRFQQVISRFLSIQVNMMGMLPEDKIVSTSVMRQIPYVLLNDQSPISKAIKQITDNYVTNTNKLNEIKPFSFLQKLKQLVRER